MIFFYYDYITNKCYNFIIEIEEYKNRSTDTWLYKLSNTFSYSCTGAWNDLKI